MFFSRKNTQYLGLLQLSVLLAAGSASHANEYERNYKTLFNASQSGATLTDYLGQPLVVYSWSDNCSSCVSDLIQLNEFAEQGSFAAVSILTQQQNKQAPQQLEGLTHINHLSRPYPTAKERQQTQRPVVRVYNRYGELAALYPGIVTNQWPEVLELVKNLRTAEFADYARQGRQPEAPNDGNIFKLDSVMDPGRPALELSQIPLGPQIGAVNNVQRSTHSLALSAPELQLAFLLQEGRTTTANFLGIHSQYVHPLSIDQRLVLEGQALTAPDYELQTVFDSANAPEDSKLRLGYEGYFAHLRYAVDVFYQNYAYRSQQGLRLNGQHLFWNDRVKIELGAENFSGSHDGFVTVTEAEDDTNRGHHGMISYRLNDEDRLALRWYHQSQQGIIENPDDLVEFGQPGFTGQQYALYPSTRTSHNYVIEYGQDGEKSRTVGYGFYDDTWGIEQHTLFVGFDDTINQWQVQTQLSLTHQVDSKFFNDLFPFANAQSLLTRNPHYAGFNRFQMDLKGLFPLPTRFQVWSKPTYLTLGAQLGYYNFETLSEGGQTQPRKAIDELVFSSSLGIRIQL